MKLQSIFTRKRERWFRQFGGGGVPKPEPPAPPMIPTAGQASRNVMAMNTKKPRGFLSTVLSAPTGRTGPGQGGTGQGTVLGG